MLGEDARKSLDCGEDWVKSAADNSWITPGLTPSKASGSESHNMPAANSVADSAAASRVPSAVGVEEDAEPDEEVLTNDDEDEMMFCSNPVDESFGEEKRWTTANAEENAAAMEIEDAEENAATLEIEANEAVPAPW
ncbi:hypothetical protein ACQ4PT_060343 [Festuca glaucescens]